MNDFWYKATIFGLLLMFVCAPFAGFAPLLLIILIGGCYWFFAPVVRAFFARPEAVSDRSGSMTVESQSESTKNKG